MPTNNIAYLTAAQAPLEVREGPYPAPADDQIIIRNRAIALNPVDYAVQLLGTNLFPWLTFPHILGTDVAGEVVEVGSGVRGFAVGDRVLGQTSAAFQTYPVLAAHMAAKIPSSLSFEKASVIPLGLVTASTGLFGKDYLALQYPTVNTKHTGKTLLIWGGATSVGSNGIQAAVSAGYHVISTASPKNFDYVKSLGASHVFDYNSPTVEDDIIEACKGKDSAGALAISGVDPEGRAKVANACMNIVSKVKGRKFVAMAMPAPEDIPEGVEAKFINAFGFADDVELATAVFHDYLAPALAAGKFRPAPEAEVVGEGLESLQGAMETLMKGVSAKKLVVTV